MTQQSPTVDPTKTSLLWEHKHSRPLTACHWDPANRFVFFGAEDNLVHRLDLQSKAVVPFAAHDSWVRAMGSSPDGQFLYTAGYDGRLVWWPAAAEQPAPLRMVDAHAGWVRAIAASADGQRLATCGNDRAVKLWDAAQGTLLQTLSGHQSHVYNVIFTPDGHTLISCDLRGNVLAWNLQTQMPRTLATVAQLHAYDDTFRADIGGARSIAVRTDGAQLALGGITNVTNAFAGVGELVVALVDIASGKIDQLLRSKGKTQGATWGVAHHPAGFWIGLSGGGGGWFHFWKGDAEHEMFQLKLKSDGRGMSISPDRSQIAVAHADAHLRAYTH